MEEIDKPKRNRVEIYKRTIVLPYKPTKHDSRNFDSYDHTNCNLSDVSKQNDSGVSFSHSKSSLTSSFFSQSPSFLLGSKSVGSRTSHLRKHSNKSCKVKLHY